VPVDVVAYNGARLSLSLRTGELRRFTALWRCCWRPHRDLRCVVWNDIDTGFGSNNDRLIAGRPRGRQQM